MLEVCAAQQQRITYIGQFAAGENAHMALLHQMGQHQALPVPVQHIQRALRCALHAAALGQRFNAQMHFGIVAQRLKVPDAQNRRGNRLFVNDASLVKGHPHPEPFQDPLPEHFQLHLSHQMHMDLTQRFLPQHAQHRILFLQQAQFGKQGNGAAAIGQAQPVVEHRLQHRRIRGQLRSQAVARPGLAQPGDSADCPRLRLIHCPEFCAGIDADLIDLFLPRTRAPVQQILDPQAAARNLQISQTIVLFVPSDFKHFRSKRLAPLGQRRILRKHLQETIHPVQQQRSAETAGRYRATAHSSRNVQRRQHSPLQIPLQ